MRTESGTNQAAQAGHAVPRREAEGRAGVERRLHRSLGRMDIILLTIAAVISIDTIGQIASSGGAESFTWTAVIVLTFMIPYGLVIAELGSSFPQEGGPYVWVRLAFGRFWASLSTMYYWITNPVWLGGSLTFLAATTWSAYVAHTHEGALGDYIFKLGFIWLAILSAIVSLRYGKWLLNVGAILKVLLVAVFVVTVIVYAVQHGVHGYAAGSFSPTTAGFLAVTPIILFAVVGFEAQNGAAEEMRNPSRDVPVSVAASGTVSALCYLVPIFGILAVLQGLEDLRCIRVHGRDRNGLRRVRLGGALATAPGGAAVHLCAAEPGKRVDDRLGPGAGDRGCGRNVPAVLRGVPPDAGHSGAGQLALRCGGDGVLRRRDDTGDRQHGGGVHRGPVDRGEHAAVELSDHLPHRGAAAQPVPALGPPLPGSRWPGRNLGLHRADLRVGTAGLVRGSVSRHSRVAARDQL